VADPNDSFHRARARLGEDAERVIETACALVFLKGDMAIKLKKPVDFGYLDFSTPEKRRWATERELDLNRRTAPDVYRALDEVEGETVLIMRRFDEDAVLAEAPEQVDAEMAEALGRRIARFHAAAELAPQGGGAANIDYVAKSNAHLIGGFQAELGAEKTRRLERATFDALRAVAPLLDRRREQGFSRRCHGDLHLGNIFVERGEPVLFDCIEFSDLLSDIDALYDLAFLVMDLWFRGRREAANRVLNAWLDEAERTFGAAVWTGLAALPLFLSIRAGVRCHVACNAGAFDEGRRYLDAALELIEPGRASLTAVGGLSGSGKSTWARRTAPALGAAPGAAVLRTDEIRKRLWGAAATEPLPPEAYAPEVGERVYARLFAEARLCLDAGRAVILDAAFLKPGERDGAQALAESAGVAFDGVWLDVPKAELRRRIVARTGDASDADLQVLEQQLARDLGEIGWRREAG
jgi:aminoglycoside phosphotransferase family enzyme/predicted kinase